MKVARDGVNIRPEELEPKKEEAVKAEKPAPAGLFLKELFLEMDILNMVLARVDTRLLHGQVCYYLDKINSTNTYHCCNLMQYLKMHS